MKAKLQKVLGYVCQAVPFAIILMIGYVDHQKKVEEQRFAATFGVPLPKNIEERQVAYPYVQAELARLDREDASPEASTAVKIAWIQAHSMAMKYHLTRDDQLMESVDQAMVPVLDSIARINADLPGESGLDVLRRTSQQKKN